MRSKITRKKKDFSAEICEYQVLSNSAKTELSGLKQAEQKLKSEYLLLNAKTEKTNDNLKPVKQ